MSEKDLIELGVTAKVDRVKLLAFARRSDTEREEKMKKLKEIIEQGKASRCHEETSSFSCEKKL